MVGFFPVLSLTSAENGDSFFSFSSFLSSATSTFFSVIASLSPGFSSATKFYRKKNTICDVNQFDTSSPQVFSIIVMLTR